MDFLLETLWEHYLFGIGGKLKTNTALARVKLISYRQKIFMTILMEEVAMADVGFFFIFCLEILDPQADEKRNFSSA